MRSTRIHVAKANPISVRTQSRTNTCGAKLRGALEPVDRAEEVPLSDRHAAMTQDVVRRCYKEEKIRQGELLQIVVALHFPVVAAAGPSDDLALRAVDLCASQGLWPGSKDGMMTVRRQSLTGHDEGQAK